MTCRFPVSKLPETVISDLSLVYDHVCNRTHTSNVAGGISAASGNRCYRQTLQLVHLRDVSLVIPWSSQELCMHRMV